MANVRNWTRALRGAALMLLLIALAAALTACGGGKKIDASTLINVEFQGLNGEGKAVLTFDQDKLVETLSKEKALTERQLETLAALGSDLQKDFSVSKREGLSNGDTVEITGGLGKDLLKDLGYGINNDTLKVTVEGLIDPLVLNAADYVTLNLDGFDGSGSAYANFDADAFSEAVAARWAELYPDRPEDGYLRGDAFYNCAYGVQISLDKQDGFSNGDEVKGAISVAYPEIEECGITLQGGDYSAVVSGLAEPESVDLASAVNISFEGIVPDVRVRYEIDYDLPFVRYTSLYNMSSSERAHLYNGDEYTLEITYDPEELRARGFIATNDTVTATVSGLPSYDFALTGLDDPLLADVAAGAEAEAQANLLNSLDNVRSEMLGEREGWVRYDAMATALEGEVTALRDNEDGADNLLFLIYHTAAPLRLVDGTAATGESFTVVEYRGVTQPPEGKLAAESSVLVRRFTTMDEADALITDEISRRMGDGATVTRLTAEETVQIPAVETKIEPAVADTSEAATERLALGELTPDYIRRVETWETMTDPYGNAHENSMAIYAGDRARVDYLLDGAWTRFTGTLCTDSDAGTEAKMSLYIWGDGRVLYAVDAYQRSQPPQDFAIDVTGVQKLSIQSVCYGRNDHAWLFICDGALERVGEAPAKDCRLASLADVLIADAIEMENEPWSSMYTDLSGSVMRDSYMFDSADGSLLRVKLGGEFTRFEADALVVRQPWPANATAKLDVLADGAPVAAITGISPLSAAPHIDLDVTGVQALEFRASTEGEDGGRVEFALANTLLTGEVAAEAQAAAAEPTEYAPLEEATLAMFEGEYAAEEIRSLASGNYRYVIVNKPSDYATAEFAAMRLGGTLATPKTNRSNAALTALIREYGGSYWIGAKRQTPQSETWVWADGEIMTDMSHWDGGEPNNTNDNESCAMIYSNGTWNDSAAEEEKPFVVQLPAVSGGLPEGVVQLADLPCTGADSMELVGAEYDGGFDPLALQINAYYEGWASYDLNGAYESLDAVLHVHPDSNCNSRATIAVFGDGRLLYQADGLKRSDPAQRISLDVSGVKTLKVMGSETAAREYSWIDITDAWLTPAAEPAQTQAVEAQTLETVDAREMGVRTELSFDSMGGAQPGWIALDAADEAYVMYNLGGGYTRATGIVCGGPDSALGETAQVRVYVDGELAATLDGVARDGAAQRFEVDITGASTLRFETSRNGEYWENVVYLAGLALE